MNASFNTIRFRRETVDGVAVHVQEAGDPAAFPIVLLHGFPSTSRMWERLVPVLATKYYVIAPDYPGFGLSEMPSQDAFAYTFDNIATAMATLLRQLGIARYAIVMQDYGGPIAWRMAIADPSAVALIVAQNNAAYAEALGPTWDARKAFWEDPHANRERLQKNLLSFEAARTRHIGRSPNPERYDPNSWHDEHAMLNRPGMAEVQTTLFYDYRNNVASYPAWQAWLRDAKPRMQLVWGRYDLSFMVEGAAGFARDNPNCETHIIDAGHFPLDEKPDDVAALHMEFLERNLV
jgi:pimeloyl-ACP methyl ester carboxylesterase